MKFLRISLEIFVIIAFGRNVEVKSEKTLCDKITDGMQSMYCWYNHPNNPGCYKKKLTVKFYYYENNSEEDDDDDELIGEQICPTCPDVGFEPKNRTTIIIHGYLATRRANWIAPMIKELHHWKNDMNIIVVEWFKNVIYSSAAQTVDDVANKIVDFIREQLFSNSNIETTPKMNYIHIIGHSLGAHIAGLTASKLKNTGWSVDRVTGLDPAKPFFDNQENAAYRLNKNCAKFVDVIHTNSGPNNEATFGLYEPVGHIDFYPNKGDFQPLCNYNREGKTFSEITACVKKNDKRDDIPKITANFLQRLIEDGDNMICDHEIAPTYFTQSLRGKRKFFATKVGNLEKLSKKKRTCNVKNKNCEADKTCAEMGIYAAKYRNNSRHGIYFVETDCSPLDESEKSWSEYLFNYFFNVQDKIYSYIN